MRGRRSALREGGRQGRGRMREKGAAWSAQDSPKQTVCKLETGKHSPVWNNGGWRRLPLSTRFPEPGHPVPSVPGCLLPPMGGLGLSSGGPDLHLTPGLQWTSPGLWEEAAPPTCLPVSCSLGRGPWAQVCCRLLPIRPVASPSPHLPGDSPTLPPPSSSAVLLIPPSARAPPLPSPPLTPLPQARASQVYSPPPYSHPLKSPPLFFPVTKSRCEASQTEAEGREPQRPGLQDVLLQGQLGSGEGMGFRAGVFGLKDQSWGNRDSIFAFGGGTAEAEGHAGRRGVPLPHVRSGLEFGPF